MLGSPLTGTFGVIAAMALLAIPLHRLTSRDAATPAAPPSTVETPATGSTPALLRLKLLAPATAIRVKSAAGTLLLDLSQLPAGESEHDATIDLANHRLELAIEADLGPATADTALFLTVMPDARDARTGYLIGSGQITETLRFEWPDTP